MIPGPGVLLVDKPPGPTSHDVVRQVRRAAQTRRVGHAGTLDPFASGLLLVLIGTATRLSEYLLGLDKEYEATVHLGVETTTLDPEGEVAAESGDWAGLRNEDVEAGLAGLGGRILQTPPVYSAKKVRGEAAHRRVRRGEEVELQPVEVEIHEIRLLALDLPRAHLRVRCSSGTYIRAIARDLGRALKVGGHLTALRRTGIGSFAVDSALPLDALSDPSSIEPHVLPPSRALSHMPSLQIDEGDAAHVRLGQSLPMAEVGEAFSVRVGEPFLLLLEDELVAVAAREGDRIRPRKVFS